MSYLDSPDEWRVNRLCFLKVVTIETCKLIKRQMHLPLSKNTATVTLHTTAYFSLELLIDGMCQFDARRCICNVIRALYSKERVFNRFRFSPQDPTDTP